MLTVGVDLAAEAPRTALAWVEWMPGKAVLERIMVGADDAMVVEAVLAAGKAGVDCPLGWPERFIDFVCAHRSGHVVAPAEVAGQEWRRHLAYRETDLVVREKTGLVPLSVAADRIAHTAMRCAALLAELDHRGEAVARDGSDRVVEVYPAASLQRWGLQHRRYKRSANIEGLDRLMDELLTRAPWLDLGVHESVCRAPMTRSTR